MRVPIVTGQIIAQNYTVLEVRKGLVPMSMCDYTHEATVIELNSRFENHSRITIFALRDSIPPYGQWPLLIPAEFSEVRVKRSWEPSRIDPPCGAIAYKARVAQGHKIAIMQMMAANECFLVLAVTSWVGFPGINNFFVGFKPGMEQRTEHLLGDTLKLSQRFSMS